MKIGIIFAIEEELNAFKELVKINNEYSIFDLSFYECSINNIGCVLVQCGVGKVNAARTTQILIDNIKVDCIFNIGVAGSVNNDVNVLDVVIADKLVQHDFDITSFDHEKGYIPNVGIYINTDEYLLNKCINTDINTNKHIGVIASGDIFCKDKTMSNKIGTKFNALCVEMEGASIAQVCHLCNIPFIVIRSISDSPNANDNNTLTYEEVLTKSCKIVANYLKDFLINI